MGPEEKVNEIEAYLEKYDSGQSPTYKILHKFNDITNLKNFLTSNQRDLNQMMDVATNWEDLSLIVMHREDYEHSSTMKIQLSEDLNDVNQDTAKNRSNYSECDFCYEQMTKSIHNLKCCQHIFCDN